MSNSAPRIIVVNQTVNSNFNEWLGALTREYGPVELWSGNAPDELPGVLIRRAPPYDRSSVGSRLRTWLHFTGTVLWTLIRRGGRTPLFVVTNPPFMPLAAWLLRKCQGRPFGVLEWDIYPDILVPLGYAKPHHPFYRLWRKWHGEALRTADLIITIGEHMADALRAMASTLDLPVTVVPNWVNPEWIWPRPRSDNPFILEQKLDGCLTVLYSGNFGATHAIETILAVAERLRADDRIRFLIIGEGGKQPLVEAAVKAGRTPTLGFLPWQPTAALPFVLASADIGIVTLGEGYERLSMPSKTYSLMAAGNALLGISRAPNDLATTITNHHCGANFEPTAVEAIADWIQSLAADRSQLEPLRRQARQAAVEYFSAAHCQALLNQAIGRYLLPMPKPNQPGLQLHPLPYISPMPSYPRHGKQILDTTATAVALLLGMPVLLLLASLIRLKLGVPVLFRQQRPGLHGKPFTLYKFRTMKDSHDAQGNPLSDAQRLTWLGRFLRSTSLDELPELFNVLKGEMSLVGPRPLLMQYLERYTAEQARRHEVKPGITGWAQVNGRNALSWEEKFRLDVWYVDHASLWLDLSILLMTLWKVLSREGISQAGQATIEEFKGHPAHPV